MMRLFDHLVTYDHEELIFAQDRAAGLRAIISIHSTVLGPSLGGTRMWPYASESEAIVDAMRLAESMTYKAAAANLNLGGGKAVIIGNPHKDKTPALFRALGRAVERLGGRYITAEDVGTSVEDMQYVRETTQWVTGTSMKKGGSGDPSPTTAAGVHESIVACAEEVFGSNDLKGLTVAVQGAGHVGERLCRLLHDSGAKLIVSDVHTPSADKVRKAFGAKVVEPNAIYDAQAEVFAPCALGAILNDTTIPRLRCKVIAGAANNQLEETQRHGQMLQERAILYAPDYVANGGGLINIYYRDILKRPCAEEAWSPTGIYDNMKRVIQIAKDEGIPTYLAANRLAESRIEEAHTNRRVPSTR